MNKSWWTPNISVDLVNNHTYTLTPELLHSVRGVSPLDLVSVLRILGWPSFRYMWTAYGPIFHSPSPIPFREGMPGSPPFVIDRFSWIIENTEMAALESMRPTETSAFTSHAVGWGGTLPPPSYGFKRHYWLLVDLGAVLWRRCRSVSLYPCTLSSVLLCRGSSEGRYQIQWL